MSGWSDNPPTRPIRGKTVRLVILGLIIGFSLIRITGDTWNLQKQSHFFTNLQHLVRQPVPTLGPNSCSGKGNEREQIQCVLDTQVSAFSNGNKALLLTTIDPASTDWYNTLSTRFDSANNGGQSGYTWDYDWTVSESINSIDKMSDDLRRVHITFGEGANQSSFPGTRIFRHSGERWVESDPTEEELGAAQTKGSEHFVVSYYNWDNESVDMTLQDAESAYNDLVPRMKAGSPAKVTIHIAPINSIFPQTPFEAQGVYDSPSTIYVRSPNSNYWMGAQVARNLNTVIRHEFTHHLVYTLTHGRITSWFNEGLATWESGEYANHLPVDINKATTTKNIIDPRNLDDSFLNPHNSNQVTLAYAEAYTVVDYIVSLGGEKALLTIVNEVASGKSFDQAVSDVLGVDGDTFVANWRVYVVKRNYD